MPIERTKRPGFPCGGGGRRRRRRAHL